MILINQILGFRKLMFGLKFQAPLQKVVKIAINFQKRGVTFFGQKILSINFTLTTSVYVNFCYSSNQTSKFIPWSF